MGSFVGSSRDIGLMLGRHSTAGLDYINQQVTEFVNKAGTVAGGIGESVLSQYNQFIDSTQSNRAIGIRNMFNSYWQGDNIRLLNNVGAIQTAPDAMIRWVMANPELRMMHGEDRIEAYGERYTDSQNGQVGHMQYDYRRVTDGMVIQNDSGANHTSYHEKLLPEDYVLSIMDKANILDTYKVIEEAIEEGIDPTSLWNNSIA